MSRPEMNEPRKRRGIQQWMYWRYVWIEFGIHQREWVSILSCTMSNKGVRISHHNPNMERICVHIIRVLAQLNTIYTRVWFRVFKTVTPRSNGQKLKTVDPATRNKYAPNNPLHMIKPYDMFRISVRIFRSTTLSLVVRNRSIRSFI